MLLNYLKPSKTRDTFILLWSNKFTCFLYKFRLCTGGELFERIIEKGHFTETEAKQVFVQIMKAIYYCHSNKICHRDLKPENFLYLNKEPNSPIKVIDFGLSKIFGDTSAENKGKVFMTTRAGTVKI